MEDLIQKAKEFAELKHKGQKRKEGIPFITHPKGVVNILRKEGIKDETTLAVAWLHDTLEDTLTTYEDLESFFGKTIADNVYFLSRNVDREEYKKRIENSNYAVKIVKLADTLHNIHNPYSLSYLPQRSIKRKIDDCKSFYIPLGMKINQSIGYQLKKSIDDYQKIFGGKTI